MATEFTEFFTYGNPPFQLMRADEAGFSYWRASIEEWVEDPNAGKYIMTGDADPIPASAVKAVQAQLKEQFAEPKE